MNKGRSEEWAEVHDAADRLYRSYRADSSGHRTSVDQIEFLEKFGADPYLMATMARVALGNIHDPIDDVVSAASHLSINTGAIPAKQDNRILACGLWVHEIPILLTSSQTQLPSVRYAVAKEIGGILVTRGARAENVRGRHLGRLTGHFADVLLYPDSAAKELKHAATKKRFEEHKADFRIDGSVIARQLARTYSK